MQITYTRLNRLVTSNESRFGRWGWAVISSLILMGLAAIYVRPATECVALGVSYARLAADPFGAAGNNPLAFRILTPLISYFLGLRGELIIITNLLFAALFLVTTYLYFRTQAPKPGDSLVAAAVMCFSLVTLTTIYYGGYTDSTTYLIILLMWITRKNRLAFFVLFLLGLFNRESIAFLVPWFCYLYFREANNRTKTSFMLMAGFGVTIGLYMLFRQWMSAQQTVAYDLAYYWRPLLENPLSTLAKSYPYQSLGLFTVFKAFWLIPFVAGYSLWKSGQRHEIYSMIILMVCTGAQLIVAFDSSRMLTMGFLVMFIALKHLFSTDALYFRKWVGWLILLNFLVPQLYTAKVYIDVMRSLPSAFLWSLFVGN